MQKNGDVDVIVAQSQRPVLRNIATDALLQRSESQQTDVRPSTPTISASEAIFEQLANIQKIQDALFDDHMRLENLPSGLPEETAHHHSSFAGSPSSSAHGEKSPHGRKHRQHASSGTHHTKSGHHKQASTSESAEEKNKKDTEAYDRLAAQFADREDNIESMMQKVSSTGNKVGEITS